MPAIAVGDLVQSVTVCTAGSQTALNIRHWVCTGVTGVSAEYQVMAAQIDATVSPLYQALLQSSGLYYGAGVKRLAPAPPTDWFSSTANQAAGSAGGDLLPRQSCGLVRFRTGLAGRANRGRLYIPFPGETDNDTLSVPTAGYQTRANALATFFITILTVTTAGGTADMIPVIYHRATSSFTSINTGVAEPYWATQRRRGSFGAVNFPPF